MMYVISRYNDNPTDWIKDYTDEYIIYDRSVKPVHNSVIVPNIGGDLYDKLTYIIDHYDDLPEIAAYVKANFMKFMPKDEFDVVKDTKEFTPLLTQKHTTYMPICFYKDGLYYEINNRWYLNPYPCKSLEVADELMDIMGIRNLEYIPFAPGTNYIIPKKNILQHPKELYVKLRNHLSWNVYPGELQIMERGLYTFFKLPK